jgi:hypothetical protein
LLPKGYGADVKKNRYATYAVAPKNSRQVRPILGHAAQTQKVRCSFLATKLSNADLTAKALQHDADLLFR